MIPSSICADAPLLPCCVAAACGRASARQGCDGGGYEDSRVRADYTIWRVRTACAGLVFVDLLGWVRGVGEADNKIRMVCA